MRGFVRFASFARKHIFCSERRGVPVEQNTTSLWLATSAAPKFESLRKDVHVDVAIIGAGITGMSSPRNMS